MMPVTANNNTVVYLAGDNITSPLGHDTDENWNGLIARCSGVKTHQPGALSHVPFCASLFESTQFNHNNAHLYTRFEQLLVGSITDALVQSGVDVKGTDTILIIATTKGNIELLETAPDMPHLHERIALHTSAGIVAKHFGFVHQPVIISSACISGVLAILTGTRLIQSGQYKNAVVAGADVISKFIVSGFQSFQALSSQLCKPFDERRIGLNLGEGAATMVLSADARFAHCVKIKSGAVSNDANHISGPSRTGDELGYAINNSLHGAGLSASDVGFISAHGTATPYNDEMEANAIAGVGLDQAPLNSLKGYYGHTLGAAGLIETIISVQSLQKNLVLGTLGFTDIGVTHPVNVFAEHLTLSSNNFLKIASGFGGCNAAIILGH
jgi:3-oxoacyl-[acyl-carrier-protein] synthase-1